MDHDHLVIIYWDDTYKHTHTLMHACMKTLASPNVAPKKCKQWHLHDHDYPTRYLRIEKGHCTTSPI